MVIRIKEKTLEEIEAKVNNMFTVLNKIAYLESALKENFSYKIKRFIWEKLVELYEERGMYEKAGKAMSNKAGIDFSFLEKIESYLRAAELYSKAGKIEDAEEMFIRALKDASIEQEQKIRLAMKNIFLINAAELEKKDKRVAASKFYERLIKMHLDELEKSEIKEKLVAIYKSLGKFREMKLLVEL